jgi:plastocyanin
MSIIRTIMKNAWIGIVVGVLVLLVLIGVFQSFSGSGNIVSTPTNNEGNVGQSQGSQDGNGAQPDKVFVVTGGAGFTFNIDGQINPDMIVNQGDLVRIEFTNDDAMPHDWVLDEFNAKTEIIQRGGSTFVEFVASEAGMFEYYCNVGQHRANGMKGSFIVQ